MSWCRRQTRLVPLAVLMAVCCWMRPTLADDSLELLARRITQDKSFQVRVQAALGLGVSRSQRAVAPLCSALNDEVASVRTAAGAALARLRLKAGASCLQARLGREGNRVVKAQLQRALARIEQANGAADASRAARPPNSKSVLYVAVEATLDNSNSLHDVDRWVQSTIRRKLLAQHNVAIAPHGELGPAFARTAKRHGLRGVLLRPTVEKVTYEGATLTVVLRLTLFTYPDMALQAEFAPKLTMTMPTARRNDGKAEEELIRMAALRAIEKFVETSI